MAVSWSATTLSGTRYDFDTDAGTVTRVNMPTDGPLRRDEEPIALLALGASPMVGNELIMWLDLRGDGVPTLRRTSPVTVIDGAVDGPGTPADVALIA